MVSATPLAMLQYATSAQSLSLVGLPLLPLEGVLKIKNDKRHFAAKTIKTMWSSVAMKAIATRTWQDLQQKGSVTLQVHRRVMMKGVIIMKRFIIIRVISRGISFTVGSSY